MSLVLSNQVWLEAAGCGGAVSMSEFNRLSADWDLSRRALNTGRKGGEVKVRGGSQRVNGQTMTMRRTHLCGTARS